MTDRTKRAKLYRQAARRMEQETALSCFPCWNIAEVEGVGYENWPESTHVKLFLSAFSDRKTVDGMSDHYIKTMYLICGGIDRDFSITALCFMAAMVEAGDA